MSSVDTRGPGRLGEVVGRAPGLSADGVSYYSVTSTPGVMDSAGQRRTQPGRHPGRGCGGATSWGIARASWLQRQRLRASSHRPRVAVAVGAAGPWARQKGLAVGVAEAACRGGANDPAGAGTTPGRDTGSSGRADRAALSSSSAWR